MKNSLIPRSVSLIRIAELILTLALARQSLRAYRSLIFISFLTLSLQAQETFSIVAIDTLTGEVGSAGATCLTTNDCGGCGGAVIISDLVPGKGAMNAQATVCIPNINLQRGIQQMEMGRNAVQVLDYVLENDGCSFGNIQSRQYGIVTIDDNGQAASIGYTGTNALDYKNHLTGDYYAIQGNILLGPQVLDSMEQRFLRASGTLAERLMAAMQGANIPGADSRCLADGLSSKSAFLRVARPDDTNGDFFLDLNVPLTVGGRDPIDSLQSLFDTWLMTSSTSEQQPLAYQLFPNPASSTVYIDLPNTASRAGWLVQLYDLQGKLLLERRETQNRITISRPTAGSGIYLFRISDPEAQRQAEGRIVFTEVN